MKRYLLRFTWKKLAIIYLLLIVYFIFLFQPQEDIAEWAYDMAASTFLLSKSITLNLPVEEVFNRYFGAYTATPDLYRVLEYNLINFMFQSFLSAVFYIFLSGIGLDLITTQIFLYFFIWLLTFACAYLLGKILWNRKFGFLFACMFSTLPYFNVIVRSGWIQVSIVPMSAMLGALLIFEQHKTRGRKWLCLLCLLGIAIVMCTKYTGTVFSPVLYGGIAFFLIVLVKSILNKRRFQEAEIYRYGKWYYYILSVIFIVLFIQIFLYYYQLHFTTDIDADIGSIFRLAKGRMGSPPDHPWTYKIKYTFSNLFYQDYYDRKLNMVHDQTWYYYKPLIPIWYSVFAIFGLFSVVKALLRKEDYVGNTFILLSVGISLYLGTKYENISGRSSVAYLPWLVLLCAKGVYYISEKLERRFLRLAKNTFMSFILIGITGLSIYDFNGVFVYHRDEQQYVWSGIREVKKFLNNYENYYLITCTSELLKPALFYLADFSDNFTEYLEINNPEKEHELIKQIDFYRKRHYKIFALVSTHFNYLHNPGFAQTSSWPRGPGVRLYDYFHNSVFFENKPKKIIYSRTGFPKFYIYEVLPESISIGTIVSNTDIILSGIKDLEVKGDIEGISITTDIGEREIIFPPGNIFHHLSFENGTITGEVIYPLDFSQEKLPENIRLSPGIKHKKIKEQKYIFGALYISTGGGRMDNEVYTGRADFVYRIKNAYIKGFETFNLYNIYNDRHKATSIDLSYRINNDHFEQLERICNNGSMRYSFITDRSKIVSATEERPEKLGIYGWCQISGFSARQFSKPVEEITFRYNLTAIRTYQAQVNSITTPSGEPFSYIKLSYILPKTGRVTRCKILSNEEDKKVEIKTLKDS